jgi:hypothetical protein
MTTPTASNIGPALLALFLAWRVYVRFGRNIGRQPLQPKRMITRIVVFSVISAMVILGLFSFPSLLPYFGGSLLLGVPFAFLGLRHTKFETTAEGHFYTPNTHIGLVLTLMLAGRVGYRIVMLYLASPGSGSAPAASLQSPLTLGIIGLTAGYYIAYYTGVLRHMRDQA